MMDVCVEDQPVLRRIERPHGERPRHPWLDRTRGRPGRGLLDPTGEQPERVGRQLLGVPGETVGDQRHPLEGRRDHGDGLDPHRAAQEPPRPLDRQRSHGRLQVRHAAATRSGRLRWWPPRSRPRLTT